MTNNTTHQLSVSVKDDAQRTIPQQLLSPLKVKGIIDQTTEIVPKKLLINKSNELYLMGLCNNKGSSLTYVVLKQVIVTFRSAPVCSRIDHVYTQNY